MGSKWYQNYRYDYICLCISYATIFVDIPEVITFKKTVNEKLFNGYRKGVQFLLEHRGIGYLMLSSAVLNFFSRLTYENILPAMIISRTGGNDFVLGIISSVLGAGGILGGLFVSFFKLPGKPVKIYFLAAALSFLFGDILIGLSQSTPVWCLAGIAASFPIPFVIAVHNVIIYKLI